MSSVETAGSRMTSKTWGVQIRIAIGKVDVTKVKMEARIDYHAAANVRTKSVRPWIEHVECDVSLSDE